ncbi:hypothetical protein HYU72_00120 [Candidatus Berkelbacteria bacterium]|nr:hypothetical protein [Candidatus Berkelbacteria bacterium]
MVFIKIIVLGIAIILAVLINRYLEPLVRMVGKMYYAEKFLGNGGTYLAWRILSILLVALALWWLAG